MDLNRIIQEIESDENKRRKAEHQKRQQVYAEHQREHVLKMLTQEFSEKTVSEMRTCTSINLCRRIINEMASIYKRPPERDVENVTEAQEEGIEKIYEEGNFNVKLKKANQKYKLHDQCAIQVIPHEGKIKLKVLAPHQYDVIPDANDPERAAAYIISTYDKTLQDIDTNAPQDIQGNYYGAKNLANSDGVNQEIADQQDYQSMTKRYVIWTESENIVANAMGEIIERNPNPIGMLPFIDVASDKDFEFWVRRGSNVVEFSLDFSVVLSDTVNTNRLQSYAQPVIVAEKVPESVTVGPQHILFLPISKESPELKPSFEFASPNPDLKASLDLQDRLISYFLTSQGIDPKTITSNGEANKFTSGLERLLAMIERFEASQDDLDLFKYIEYKLFVITRAWYDAIKGTPALLPEYDFGEWPEQAKLVCNFKGPEMLQTVSDKEDSVIKLLDSGLINKTEAVMQLRGVSKQEAEEIVSELEAIPGMDKEQMSTDQAVTPEQQANGVSSVQQSGVDIRKETLNGAQLDAVVSLVQEVAAGRMPRDAAKAIMQVGLNLDASSAEALLGSAGAGFKVTPQELDQSAQKNNLVTNNEQGA